MKKVLFVLALVITMISNAQTEKGKFVISGSTGLSFASLTSHEEYKGEETDDVKTKSFSIQPAIGYFVANGLYIGLATDISSEKQEYSSEEFYGDEEFYSYSDENKTNTTVIMPVIGYYFPVKGKLKPFAQFGIGLASVKNTYDSNRYNSYTYFNGFEYVTSSSNYRDELEEKYSGLALEGSVGVSYFISKSISFNLGLSYTSLNTKLKEYKNIEYYNNIKEYEENIDDIDGDLKSKTRGLGIQLGVSIFL